MKQTQLEKEAEHYANRYWKGNPDMMLAYIAGARRSDLEPTRASFIVPFIVVVIIAITPVYIAFTIGLSNTSDKILFCVFCILFIFFMSITVISYKTYKRDKMLY